MNIGSKIEEEPEKYYHNFGYDEKIMKINTIQIGLQCSSKKEIILSTLVYLNDLYKTHFIFVDSHKNRFYQTCCKNYPIHYLIWNQKFCTLEKTISPLILEDNIDNSIITKDLKNTNPYKSYLKAISKYKIDELKKIATDLNISLKADGKNKVKQVLYNEINTYQLNKI